MFCSHCGRQISDTANFCKYCGTGTKPPKKTCPNCRHENDDNSIYCEECGTKIENEKPPVAVSNECEIKAARETKTSNKLLKDKLEKAFSIALMIATIVFFVVTIGLSFGRYAVQYAISSSSSISADDIVTKIDFSYLTNAVKSLKDLPSSGSIAVQIERINSMVSILSVFIVAIIGIVAVIAIAVIGIVKESINLSKGRLLQKSKLLLASIIVFMTFSSYLASAGINSNLLGVDYSHYSLGYSPLIVIVFGSILLLLRLAYWLAFNFDRNKVRLFVGDSLMIVSIITSIVLIVFLSGDYASITKPLGGVGGNVFVGSGLLSSYQMKMSALVNSSSSSNSPSISTLNKLIVIYNTFFFLASAFTITIPVLLYCFLQGIYKRTRDLSLVILPSVIAFLSLSLMIFVPIETAIAKSICSEVNILFSIGVGNIVVFVLSIIVLGLGIATFVLREKKTDGEAAR